MAQDKTIQKLKLAFFIVLVLILSITLFSIYNIRSINETYQHTSNVIQKKVTHTNNLRYFTRERSLNLHLMILNDDPFIIDENWLAFNKFGAQFAQNRIALQEILRHPKEIELLDNQGNITAKLIPELLSVANLAMNAEKNAAMKKLVTKVVPLQEEVFNNLDLLSEYLQSQLGEAKKQSIRSYEKVVLFSWISGFFAMLAAIITSIWIIRRVRKYQSSLRELNTDLEKSVNQRTKQLADSEAKQRSIVDNAIDGIISINRNGNIESFNPSAQEMLGYSSESALTKTLDDILNYEDIDSEGNSYHGRVNLSQIKGETAEMMALKSDGSSFPVLVGVSHVRNNDFNQHYTCIVRDITEQKLIQQIKTEFIANMSHEIRTPVTSIHGSLGLLLGGVLGKIPEKAFEMLKLASNNSDRLVQIINNILDFQKIEADVSDIKFKENDMVSLIQEAINAETANAKNKDINILFQKTVDVAFCQIDIKRMKQAIVQLISNAIKYSEQGGHIIIGIDQEENHFRITFTDFGEGIAEDFKSSVFETFSQEDSSNVRRPGGTGLGLAIVKLILEKHHVNLNFISEKDKGTVFYFDIEDARSAKSLPHENLSA